MKLAVIIGHAKNKKGATGVYPIAEHEFDFNYKLAMDFFRISREIGISCQLFDKTNDNEIYNKVNEFLCGEGVSIELHFNASMGSQAQGTETLYVKDYSKEFATDVHKAICMELKRKGKQDRGVKKLIEDDRGYKNLKDLECPACLIEPAFADNKQDARIYYDNKDNMVRQIVLCVENYLGNQVK